MAARELKGSGGGVFFKWEKVGTEFTGQFEKLGEGVYQGKPTYHAVFIDREGKTVKVNTPTILRDKLAEARPGEYVEMRYVGDKPRQGAKTGAKDFYVRVVDGPGGVSVPPQAAAASAAAPQAPPAASGGGADIGEMRAKLEARVGIDTTEAMVGAINQKYGADIDGIKTALASLLAAHGIK